MDIKTVILGILMISYVMLLNQLYFYISVYDIGCIK